MAESVDIMDMDLSEILGLLGEDHCIDEVQEDTIRFGWLPRKIVSIREEKSAKSTCKKIYTARKCLMDWVSEKNSRLRLSLRKVPTNSFE